MILKPKILYVYAPAGPPLDYCLPKMAARGEIHTCIVSAPTALNLETLRRCSAGLHDFSALSPAQAWTRVRAVAEAVRPQAVVTFSEFLLKAVSELAVELGLRGVGRHIERGRDKVAMRERWRDAGIPQPEFRAVASAADLRRVSELKFPVLVKLAYGAGSIGQQIVRGGHDLDAAVSRLLVATDAARRAGKHEFSELTGFPRLIVEEIIESSTESWYEDGDDSWGDYLSVEGLVRDGVYHPLAMTGRLRTIAPFTELGNVAPCVLTGDRKARIVRQVARAVDALEFEDCATHTEVKLMANGRLSFLETAARMGGVAIAKELDAVFGIDYVDLFLGVMLGERTELPAFEATAPRGAAASVALIACDSQGEPWRSRRRFVPDAVDWSTLLDGLAQLHFETAQSIPAGSLISPYDIAGGLLNYAGQAFLTSRDAMSLRTAAYRLLDGLESRLPPAEA